MQKELITLVIPAYFEEKRIEKSIDKINSYFKKNNIDSEIIIVLDKNDAIALEILLKIQKNIKNIKIEINNGKKGKGNSIKTGILKSSGSLIFFTDADLSTPIEEITKFINVLNKGCEVAIASRYTNNSKIAVAQNKKRKLSGYLFRKLRKLLGLVKYIEDTQCGFKGFSRKAAFDLFQNQNISGFVFDVEILHLADKKGYRIKEIPVIWSDDKDSKLRLFSSCLFMFIDLLKIKAKELSGKYDK